MAFFIPSILALELFFSGFLFAGNYPKRRLFWLKFIGYAFVVLSLVLIVEVVYMVLSGNDFNYGENAGGSPLDEVVFYFMFYCGIFAAVALVFRSAYQAKWSGILACISCAYTVQHIARQLANIIGFTEIYTVFSSAAVAAEIAQIILFFIISYVFYFLFVYKKEVQEIYGDTGKYRVIVALVVVILCIGMSRISNSVGERNALTVLTECIYSTLCGLFVILMQFGFGFMDSIRRRADYLTEVLALERKQFKMSKETIDLINIKCHDIKHQLNSFRTNIDEKYFTELEKSVNLYDLIFHTGLEALDIVLTEKSMQCQGKHIQMTCFVDGKLISFMEENDIYSLFGNALSNAIESLETVAEGKRYISVRISQRKNLVVIHIENYFDGQLEFEGALPVSGKDNHFHGFGMKSMERIVEKYKGELSVLTADNTFNLDIVLPIPEAVSC